MDLLKWIERELNPRVCNSVEFMYDDMESQSDYCLPIIYQPFDANNKGHWRDRGALFDFLLSTNGEGKRLLDFGPGDGWPSLIVAPFAGKLIGVDGSHRRVEVCIENAERLGISNAKFIYVKPGDHLPFEDNSFDGVMAASSVEQTPDPKVTLQEFYRILKPEGRLRMCYENLSYYRNGKEKEANLKKIDDNKCCLTLYDRHIDEESARMYKIIFSKSKQEVKNILAKDEKSIGFDMISIPLLNELKSVITESRICTLIHPSGETFVAWLNEIGFREVIPSHGGDLYAGQLFDQFSDEDRPKDIKTIDRILKPLVKIIVQMPAPFGIPTTRDPMITAIK